MSCKIHLFFYIFDAVFLVIRSPVVPACERTVTPVVNKTGSQTEFEIYITVRFSLSSVDSMEFKITCRIVTCGDTVLAGGVFTGEIFLICDQRHRFHPIGYISTFLVTDYLRKLDRQVLLILNRQPAE